MCALDMAMYIIIMCCKYNLPRENKVPLKTLCLEVMATFANHLFLLHLTDFQWPKKVVMASFQED